MGCAQVICTKVRDGDKRIVRLKEGEPKGRHVVIVDDLVQSGGTLIECQKLLASQVRPLPSLASNAGPRPCLHMRMQTSTLCMHAPMRTQLMTLVTFTASLK